MFLRRVLTVESYCCALSVAGLCALSHGGVLVYLMFTRTCLEHCMSPDCLHA